MEGDVAKGFCPVLIGKVVSDSSTERDRYRLILQLAVNARLGSLLAGSSFVALAIYINKDYEAERYLACAEPREVKFPELLRTSKH